MERLKYISLGIVLVQILALNFPGVTSDFSKIVMLTTKTYDQVTLTCSQSHHYLTQLADIYYLDYLNRDEFLSDSMVEMSHIMDYVLVVLEETKQTDADCLNNLATVIAKITNAMLGTIKIEICLSESDTDCSLNAFKAFDLIEEAESFLLRMADIIVTDTSATETTIVDQKLTVIAFKGKVKEATELQKLGGIIDFPAAKPNVSLDMEIIMFVIANDENMYTFVEDSSMFNAGTMRTYVRDMQGEYVEVFDEIDIHVDGSDIFSNMSYYPETKASFEDRNVTDTLRINASFTSDKDGGLFVVFVPTIKKCFTTLTNEKTSQQYKITTEMTDTVTQDNTPSNVSVSFRNQTIRILLLPPMDLYSIAIFCETCLTTADVVFIADSSGSVGAGNFKLMKHFMADFVSRLEVRPPAVRIGLMTFSFFPMEQFYLNTYDNGKDTEASILKTPYSKGGTYTAEALKRARTVMFESKGSNREVQRVAIVITDGVSQNAQSTQLEAKKLRESGVEVVSVGVGGGTNVEEVTKMASSKFHVFHVENFDGLEYLSKNIIDTICKGQWLNLTSPRGTFGKISGYSLDDVKNAWRRNPAPQLKALEDNVVVFKSDFLGTYGLSVWGKEPETINFDAVFTDIDDKIAETPHVLSLNCALLACLVVGSVILHALDKRDSKMWHYRPLVENPDDAEYVYFISLHTGMWSSPQFTPTTYIILTGWYGESGVRALTDGSFDGLVKWKYSNFALTTKNYLGPLTELKIWHDDKSASERLYIEKILIADASDGERYAFLTSENWLAADRADGNTHRVLFPSNSELHDGKTLFSSITRFNMFDDYLWLSLISRPSFSRFSRVQRLVCISSMISLSMMASCMWYNTTSDGHIYGIRVGPISINYMQVYVGFMTALISFPPCCIMTMVFRNRKLKGEHIQLRTENFDMNLNSDAKLPWPYIFVGYFIAFLSLGSGAFFTTLYSLQWGPDTSEEWLMSITLGTANDVVFLAPVKAVLGSLVLAAVLKNVARKSILEMAPFNIEEEPLIRKSVEPSTWPGDADISKAQEDYKNKLILDAKLFSHLSAMAIQLLFILLIVIICSHNTVENSYLQNTELLNLLKPPNQINILSDIWDWLKNYYIPQVFPKFLYNNKPRLPPERKLMADDTSHRMGPVRLRQHRIKDSCDIPDVMKKVMNMCLKSYSKENIDTTPYCPGWKPYLSKCRDDGFTYTPAKTTAAYPYYGTYHTYGGDGYIKDINPFKVEVLQEISKLQSNNWIDRKSRFVSVEVIVLNGNTKLFSSVSLMFEMPTVGSVILGYKIQSSRLYPYIDVSDYVVLVLQLVFVLLTFIRSLLLLYDIWQLKWNCFTSLRFYAKCLSIATSIAAIGIYIARIDRTIYIVEKIFNSADEFLSFEVVQIYDDVYKTCIGVVLFIAILTMLRSLSFNYYLYMMRASIIITQTDLLSFTGMLSIPLVAFACITNLYMGSYSYAFKNMLSSVLSLFRTLIAMVKFREFHGSADSGMIGTEILFSLFIFMMTIILMNMFVCILNDGFAYVKEKGGNLTETEPFDEALNKHFWAKLGKLFNCIDQTPPESKYSSDSNNADNWNNELSDLMSRLDDYSNDEVNSMSAILAVISDIIGDPNT